MTEFLTILWLFVPAAIANMMARLSFFFPKIALLERPVDGGRMFKGKPILGKNKTTRGVVYATAFAGLTAIVQFFIVTETSLLNKLIDINTLFEDYTLLNSFIFGLLVGFGAMFGDMVESFIKRQIGIPSGKPFFPFDQTDFVFGAILISFLFRSFPIYLYIELLLLYFVGHLIVKFVGYKLKLDNAPI